MQMYEIGQSKSTFLNFTDSIRPNAFLPPVKHFVFFTASVLEFT